MDGRADVLWRDSRVSAAEKRAGSSECLEWSGVHKYPDEFDLRFGILVREERGQAMECALHDRG